MALFFIREREREKLAKCLEGSLYLRFLSLKQLLTVNALCECQVRCFKIYWNLYEQSQKGYL